MYQNTDLDYVYGEHRFFNTSPEENDWHFADSSFKCIFLDENPCMFMKNLLKFDPKSLGPDSI